MTYCIIKEYPSSLTHPEETKRTKVAGDFELYIEADQVRIELCARHPGADFFVGLEDEYDALEAT